MTGHGMFEDEFRGGGMQQQQQQQQQHHQQQQEQEQEQQRQQVPLLVHMRPPHTPLWKADGLSHTEATQRLAEHEATVAHVTRGLVAAGATLLTPKKGQVQIKQGQDYKTKLRSWRKQEVLDYADVLDACSKTRANYTIIVEEDAFATPNFYAKVRGAIQKAERAEMMNGDNKNWWIKLFVTDWWSGWAYPEDAWVFPACFVHGARSLHHGFCHQP
jgi:hypothetical protein